MYNFPMELPSLTLSFAALGHGVGHLLRGMLGGGPGTARQVRAINDVEMATRRRPLEYPFHLEVGF